MARGGGRQSGRSNVPARVREAQIAARTEIMLSAIPWIGWAALVVLTYIPLQAVQPMIDDLAGKDTNVTMSVSLSIAINVVLAGTFFVQKARMKRQQRELIRLRGRLEEIDKNRVSPTTTP
jgi:hypothetical protein